MLEPRKSIGPHSGRGAVGWRGTCPLAAVVLALGLALPATPAGAQQTGSVTGRVTSAGQPVAAVQVFLVGTGLGTLTNADGRFVILNVPAGTYTLRAELIGLRPGEREITVAAGQSAQANFDLEVEALGLDEIVVTGTAGAARRREVGNSVAQIDLARVRESPVNVDALLQSRTPGMTVLQSSANIGGGAMIRLRGNSSVTMSNQPIIYVDGVRMRSDGYARNVPHSGSDLRSSNDIAGPLNNINPSDIERVEVIKGSAATTLYGTEAAAGVIQIFTKRGHTGTPHWTVQVDQGFSHVLPFGPDPSRTPPSENRVTAAGGTSDYMFINPWLRNGHRQRYSASVAGGTNVLRYFVSGAYENNEGVLPNDHEEKVNIRGNFTFSPLPNIQVNWNTAFTHDDLSNTPAGNNAHGLTLNAYRRDRNYKGEETREAIDPLLDQELTTDIKHIITGGTVTYTPMANMTHRLTVGWDLSQVDNRNLRPFGFELQPNGVLSDRRYEYQNITLDYTGTFDFNLASDLRSSLSWGGQSIASETNETSAYGQDFPGPGRPVVSNGGLTLGREERIRVINAGFFLQNLFDLRNKYFLTLGLRVDGNSAFGRDLGLQAYPKASFSYIISDEPFWPAALGSVKLRAAWGQSGRAPGAFDAVRTYSAVGWGSQPAFFPDNVGNPKLGPERSTEIEVGFDGAFFDDRLSTDFTFYHQRTTDALVNVRQMPSLGFLNSQLRNIGELRNMGVELSVNGTILRGERFGWDLGASVYTNDSKVLDLGGAPEFSLGDFGWVVEGQPVPVIRADCVANAKKREEPVIEPNCNIGPNLPTHTFGISTTLRLPFQMQLIARGEYQGGHYMYDGAAYNAVVRSVRWPGCFDFYTLQETGREAEATALDRARCTVSSTRADYFVYPADFFKVREVTLHIPLPQGLVPRTSGASLTLTGRNVWKWVNDDFPVFEPEMGNNAGFNAPVRSLLEHVPPPATYTASLRFNF